MIGGSITVDQTVLNFKGKRRESLLGTASAGPMADSIDTPEWKKFVADYKANFKDGFPSPSLFAYLYYINTKAALDGARCGQGRPVGRPEGLPRRAAEDQLQGPGRRREDRRQPQRRRHDLHHRSDEGAGRLVLQQGREVGAEHHADAGPARRPSSRRWAWARATCPTAASKHARSAPMASITPAPATVTREPRARRGRMAAAPARSCCRATRCGSTG